MVHWVTWLGSTVALGIIAFVVAEAVPFFGTLIGLLAAIAYAPMAVCEDILFLGDWTDHPDHRPDAPLALGLRGPQKRNNGPESTMGLSLDHAPRRWFHDRRRRIRYHQAHH